MSETKHDERHPAIGCKPEDISRFWSHVTVGAPDTCWFWNAGKTRDGYGVFHYSGTDGEDLKMRAHRFAYAVHFGKLPECVCHRCDVPPCCNPGHLFAGTIADNNADKQAKGRNVDPVQRPGEANTNAVLTTAEVITVRVMARRGEKQWKIADRLGTSTANVSLILNGKRRVEETEQRVSACVNALAGIPTEALESGAVGRALCAAELAVEAYWHRGTNAGIEIDILAERLRALGRLP